MREKCAQEMYYPGAFSSIRDSIVTVTHVGQYMTRH